MWVASVDRELHIHTTFWLAVHVLRCSKVWSHEILNQWRHDKSVSWWLVLALRSFPASATNQSLRSVYFWIIALGRGASKQSEWTMTSPSTTWQTDPLSIFDRNFKQSLFESLTNIRHTYSTFACTMYERTCGDDGLALCTLFAWSQCESELKGATRTT